MRITLYTLWIFLCASSFVQAQSLSDSLNLNQLLEISNKQALGIKIIENELKSAKADYSIFKTDNNFQTSIGANLPNFFKSTSQVVQPDGSVLFRNINQNSASLNLNISKQIIATNTQVFAQSNLLRFDNLVSNSTNYNSVPIRIGIQQNINRFNPLKWEKKLFPKRIEFQKLKATRAILDQQIQVVIQYFQVIGSMVERNIASSNMNNNKIILEIAEKRYELGHLSLNDLTQIKLNGVISEQAKIDAEKTYMEMHLALKQITSHFDDFTLVTPADIPEFNTQLIASKIDYAWEQQLEQERYKLNSLEIKQEKERIKKEFQIQGNLSSSIGLVKSGSTYREAYSKPQQEMFVNLNVQVPIFQSKRKNSYLEKIKLQTEINEERKEYAQQSFKEELGLMLLQIENVKTSVSKSKEILLLAEKAFKIANERFKLGNISTTDLILANNNRDFAKRNYMNSIANYWILYYKIRAYSGLNLKSGKTIKLIKLEQ